MDQEELKTLYEMIYPYGQYDYDKVSACVKINKDLKKLCNEKFRHVLLIIARYLKLDYTYKTSTRKIFKGIYPQTILSRNI
ncbi:unnamed protein product, partial [marine sediment metagenome]